MSIRLQDITTSVNVSDADKVLVTDGTTEYLATLSTVYDAISSHLPLTIFNVSANGTKTITIAENTAGFIVTSGGTGTKSLIIFNANASGTLTWKQSSEESSLAMTLASGSATQFTITNTGSNVIKCMAFYWGGNVTV